MTESPWTHVGDDMRLVGRWQGRTLAVVAFATAVVTGSAHAAFADYSLNGKVTSRTYLGATGTGGVYKQYSYSVAGDTKVCVSSSSNSGVPQSGVARSDRVATQSGAVTA